LVILVFLVFNVKLTRRSEFAKWITEKEAKLLKAGNLAEGWKYRGTYCTRFSNSKYECAMFLEIDKYSRLDDFKSKT
jgi:hypothetical protein